MAKVRDTAFRTESSHIYFLWKWGPCRQGAENIVPPTGLRAALCGACDLHSSWVPSKLRGWIWHGLHSRVAEAVQNFLPPWNGDHARFSLSYKLTWWGAVPAKHGNPSASVLVTSDELRFPCALVTKARPESKVIAPFSAPPAFMTVVLHETVSLFYLWVRIL